MNDRSTEETPHTTHVQWARNHIGCPCTRFSDFSFSQSEDLVPKIRKIICEGLPPSSRPLPQVFWDFDADLECLAACQVTPTVPLISLSSGSCVNWTTTLVAYVHAASHILSDNEHVTGDRHGTEWQKTVDTIATLLTDRERGLDAQHFQCIRDSLRFLKKAPHLAEWSMSTPAFLTEYQMATDRASLALGFALDDATKRRRQDTNYGTVRWRFQDEFDTVDASMQLNGRVEQYSVLEYALELRSMHYFQCKCYDNEAFTPGEAKELVECLVNDILPLYLPVFFYDEPLVRCILSSKSNKAIVYDEGSLHINLNRLESFADTMRVVVREWARRFVKTMYNITENFQWDEKYLRAVAGFSTLLIEAHPFDGLLSNWFATEDCVRVALTPAPIWPNSMVPLLRLNKQGACNVLRHRTFQHLSPDELDGSRERSIIIRESAMHAGLEGTSDFRDYEDFLAIRGPVMERSFRRPTDNCTYQFRVRSVKLDLMSTLSVQGDQTVLQMTDSAVNFVARSISAPDDPSLYEVLFNDESIDETECAAKVAEAGLQIRVEPIMRQVRVLKGWTDEIVLDIGVPSTITARDLIELTELGNPDLACIVQRDCHVLFCTDTVDTKSRLRIFEEGYVQIVACVNTESEEIRDSIVVEACHVDEPLELHLTRWRWTYGIKGEVECEGYPVLSSTTVREAAYRHRADGHIELRVYAVDEPTERDFPMHKIMVQTVGGKELRHIKLKSHHTLERAFQMLCKITGMLPQSAELTTGDGFPVDPRQRMYSLRLNKDCARLVFTHKAPPKRKTRKRIGSPESKKNGIPEKRRFGKFAHPRPSVSYIVISSDSEEDTD